MVPLWDSITVTFVKMHLTYCEDFHPFPEFPVYGIPPCLGCSQSYLFPWVCMLSGSSFNSLIGRQILMVINKLNYLFFCRIHYVFSKFIFVKKDISTGILCWDFFVYFVNLSNEHPLYILVYCVWNLNLMFSRLLNLISNIKDWTWMNKLAGTKTVLGPRPVLSCGPTSFWSAVLTCPIVLSVVICWTWL